MSSSSEFSSLTAKSRDKPSAFSQTCSRLSQYIKEKGNIGDLTLGISSSSDETNDSSEMHQKRSTTMNLFPMEARFDDTLVLNDMAARAQPLKNVINSAVNKSASEEQKRAQMTIFYGGQVFVFDDFPTERAKDVMSLASKSGSRQHNSFAPSVTPNLQSIISKMVQTAVNSSTPFSPNVNITPSTNNNLIQELSRHQSNRTVICDLPITRKASLHRFLEKRKDRIASTAPYQQISSFVSGPSKPAEEEGMSWLQLAAPASH